MLCITSKYFVSAIKLLKNLCKKLSRLQIELAKITHLLKLCQKGVCYFITCL